MLSNNKCILVYNTPEKEIEILKSQEIRVIEVSEEMGEMKVSDILNGLKFETINSNMPKEAIILFNDFSDEEIKLVIGSIRQRVKGGIFATVTPTSIEWQFSYLVKHLIEERDWYLNNQKGRA